jgi:hypothetical protein
VWVVAAPYECDFWKIGFKVELDEGGHNRASLQSRDSIIDQGF